jgi:hypothetical protein
MPINPENKSKYPADWPQIRDRIREREGHCCKWCKAPNRKFIARSSCGSYYMLANGDILNADNGETVFRSELVLFQAKKWIEVVLTVAHLDHDPTNNTDENLAALCQRCHNRYDSEHRAESRAKTRALKELRES